MKSVQSSLVMCRLCVILWVLLGSLLPHVLCVHSNQCDQYGVILDAGSSGTKLKVYKWQKPKLVTEVPLMLLNSSADKFTPGIGHYAKRPENLSLYLNGIVTKAKEFVPENMRATTPIYLMATAGARILDGNIALGLLQRIRKVLSNKTINPFRFKGTNVRILSGEEEAVFAWVATNALSGFFNSTRPATESMGLLEMGGGSTQIAFVPSEPLYAGEFQIFIGGRRFDLYAHSHLFFGANYIKQRLNKYLILNRGAKSIENPCRVEGDDTTVQSENGTKVKFKGDGDPDACANILRQFLTKAKGDRCHPKPCSIGSVYQPRVGNTSFYATQAFVYTPRTMKSLDHNKILNITKMQQEAKIYCKKPYENVTREYKVQGKFASDECMLGLYLPMLMLDAYQFDPELTKITVTNKINKHRIDWTMGAMIYELFQSKRLVPHTILCGSGVNSSDGHPCVPYITEPAPCPATSAASARYIAFLETITAGIAAALIATRH